MKPEAIKINSLAFDKHWIGRQREDVLEPDLPIVDPHHHVILRPDYDYTAADYLADIAGGHRIEASVHVEAHTRYRDSGPDALRPVGETEYVRQLAGAAAIVGAADLRLGLAVDEVLAAHIEAGQGRFRGIRVQAQWDQAIELGQAKPPRLLLDRAFRAGVSRLAPMGLHLECFLFHPQLPELADLAGAFPDLIIILNHLGTPLGVGPYARDRRAVFEQWRYDLAALARHPNVMVKLGGLGMALCGFLDPRPKMPPSSEDLLRLWGPYLETAIDLFGPSRAMFESNFPIDRHSTSFTVLWNCFKRLTQPYAATDRALLFSETARRLYRLEASP